MLLVDAADRPYGAARREELLRLLDVEAGDDQSDAHDGCFRCESSEISTVRFDTRQGSSFRVVQTILHRSH